jgi:hypothetical protein
VDDLGGLRGCGHAHAENCGKNFDSNVCFHETPIVEPQVAATGDAYKIPAATGESRIIRRLRFARRPGSNYSKHIDPGPFNPMRLTRCMTARTLRLFRPGAA